MYEFKANGDIDAWLKKQDIPKLDSASREALNSELSPVETTDAIKSLHNGKSPEPAS